MKNFLMTGIIAIIVMSLCGVALSETIVLQPGAEGKDTYVCDCLPKANNPNGPITLLYQGQYGACFDRLLIQWDLSTLPKNISVDSAFMEIKSTSLTGSLSGQMVYYRIIEKWEENKVTYATLPKHTNSDSVITDWPKSGQWHRIDITKFVQLWIADTSLNRGIYGHSMLTTKQCCMGFSSSDVSNATTRPKLTITYTTSNDVEPSKLTKSLNFSLGQNFPNPFNPGTEITYVVPRTTFVSLSVFDVLGQEIDRLVNQVQSPGNYSVRFDGSRLNSGVYFYKLETDSFTEIKKCVMIK
jgi:hypothetical protein